MINTLPEALEFFPTTYGRFSGFCIDPVEKKTLNHFLPGTPILSFGTAGCNLTCKFCQNWDMSKSREINILADQVSPEKIGNMTRWFVENLGADAPMHLSAFHPDWKMIDIPSTLEKTLTRARQIALDNGVHYAYTGTVHDKSGESTYYHHCGHHLIGRDWYVLSQWSLDEKGNCNKSATPCARLFENVPGDQGAKRQPVYLKSFE